jgi:hypothetical protein
MGRDICDRFGVLSYRQKNTQITEPGIDSSVTLFLSILKIISDIIQHATEPSK